MSVTARRGAPGPRTIALIMLVPAMMLSTGCAYRYIFRTGKPAGESRVSQTMHQEFYGWIGHDVFNLEAACPQGVSEFGSEITFLDWLPALLTMGLYTPRTAWAVCAAPKEGK